MNAATYTRYEVMRAFRNRRFFIFSIGFPLVLYFVIAAPNRDAHDFGGSGLDAPLYLMVGLTAFGTMNAVLGVGARIAAERSTGWNRQLRLTPLTLARLLPHQGADGVPDGDGHDRAAVRGRRVARRADRGRALGRDDAADADRAGAVRRRSGS